MSNTIIAGNIENKASSMWEEAKSILNNNRAQAIKIAEARKRDYFKRGVENE